jgi:hypothetical protein
MARPKSGYTLLERLLNKVIINDVTDCWEWQGGKNNIGYGLMRDEKRMRTIHRVSYEEHSQTKIPAGMSVMHSCDNRICVNPLHLVLGTHKTNCSDKVAKGRQAKGEIIGNSKFKNWQVLIIKMRINAGETNSQLAKEFDVSSMCISRIRSGKTWRHL